MLKKVKLDEAVGMVLGHDVTKVIPGEFKGPAFRRGHKIKKEDIPELLSIGKEHVYIIKLEEGEVHEEEAALRIAKAISSPCMELTKPKEGKISIKVSCLSLLKINTSLLEEINFVGEVIIATLHTNTICHEGMEAAATRIIPLFVTEAKVAEVEKICQKKGKVIEVTPIKEKRVGVIITGSEVFKERIEDRFGDTIKRKVEALGSVVDCQVIVPDDVDLIAQAIADVRAKGCEVIVTCGGLSVDPDDVTVEGVKKVGAKIISYGAPVLPGTMFLYAMWDDVPIVGAPACVIYSPATIVDLILPRVIAGEDVSKEDIIRLGHGGLCLNCTECSFPICPFGR